MGAAAPGAGFVDYGKSCGLRVNNILATNVPQSALVRFALPKFQLAAPGQAVKVCGAVHWDITPLVRAGCKQPGYNHGVLAAGRAGTGSANFQSTEVPAALAASRPRLEITY